LDADLSFRHERPEGPLALAQLADGPVVHGDRQLGSWDLNQLWPPREGGHVCHRDEGDDLTQLHLEDLGMARQLGCIPPTPAVPVHDGAGEAAR